MQPKILVTGASGFVGQHVLAPMRAAGFDVHVMGRPHGDIFDPAAIRSVIQNIKPTHLLHAAWMADHGKFWHAPENAAWYDASITLFESFLDAGGQRIVGIGSCAEYDWKNAPLIRWPENTPCKPHTLYGQQKHKLHQWLEASGVDYAWARLFHLCGVGEYPARFVPYLIKAAITGAEANCSSGHQVRDFADTAEIGRALAAVAASGLKGAVNVASGQGVTLRALAASVAKAAGVDADYRFGALPDRDDEPTYMVADITKLKTVYPAIGNYSLDAALGGLVDYWRASVIKDVP